jgi:hypothetical protein
MNNNWYNIILEEESLREATLIGMSAAEWKEEAKRIIRTWRGDLRACNRYLNEIDRKRAQSLAAPVAPIVKTEFDIDFAIWKDMINEPWKYGDDIIEWLELDEKLSSQSGRWRLGAFWNQKEEEEKRKQAERERIVRENHAAIAIQAIVRGHMTRTQQPFRDCYLCLSHRTAPYSLQNEMICRPCAIDAGVLGQRV